MNIPDLADIDRDDDFVELSLQLSTDFGNTNSLDTGPKPAMADLASRLSPQFLGVALTPGLLA